MKLYIQTDETNRVYAVSSTPLGLEPIEVEVEDMELLDSPSSFLYVNGELIKDLETDLRQAKQNKDVELNQACMASILAGFDYEIGGISYHFSFDEQAQFNFQGAMTAFQSGLMQSTTWTVMQSGEYMRIPITAEDMNGLSVAIIKHKESNISKYRDDLMPKVMAAQTVEEVGEITWS